MSITKAEGFLKILDDVYAQNSKTAMLDADSALVQETSKSGVFNIFKLTLDGAANYSRANGFVAGALSGTWEPFTPSYDRGRSFSVDVVDDAETNNMVAANVLGTFVKTKIVPELDAKRLATMYNEAGTKLTGTTFSTKEAAIAALKKGLETLEDNEAPSEGNIIFTSSSFGNLLNDAVARTTMNGEGNIRDTVTEYNGNIIVRVPKGRFNTAITLKDGVTTGQESGGFAATGQEINFMIVDPMSVMQITKHQKIREFNPDENQTADAWKLDYRIVSDLYVKENKTMGIYASAKAAPVVSYKITGVAIDTAGANYAANDVLSIPGAAGDTAATLTVGTVSASGEITAATLTTSGTYAAQLSGAVAATGGTGTGAKFTLTFAVK